MMRTLIGAVIAAMIPAFAGAQEAKPVPLADYLSFCLAVWENARDLPSKASALGLSDMTGSAGASITIGKTTMRYFKAAQPALMVGVTSTTFEDGKDWSCDINLAMAVERADFETMQQVADLDGQIATLGPSILGRWKMRQPRSPVLIKVMAGKAFTMLTMQKYEPTPAGAKAKLTR